MSDFKMSELSFSETQISKKHLILFLFHSFFCFIASGPVSEFSGMPRLFIAMIIFLVLEFLFADFIFLNEKSAFTLLAGLILGFIFEPQLVSNIEQIELMLIAQSKQEPFDAASFLSLKGLSKNILINNSKCNTLLKWD